jgi:hypothetical protein
MPDPAIARRRLAPQRVLTAGQPTRDPLPDPISVVRWMGAMQAQDYHQAVWTLGARLPNARLAAIESALDAGQIIRTYPMRGTIFFVPPDDAAWMIQLTGARMIARDARRQAELGLDAETMTRAERIAGDVLSGGRRLSRPDLLQAFTDGGIEITGQRAYHILWFLAHICLICIAARDAKQPTYARLDALAPTPRALSGQAAWHELATRYFRSHSPATAHDFAWWTGATVTEARAALAALGSDVESETIDGVTYWTYVGADAASYRDAKTARGLLLLAGFDEYYLGYKDRTPIIEAAYQTNVCPGNNGVFYPTILMDGVIVGTWKRTFKRDTVTITASRFPDSPLWEREALIAAAQPYADFHGMKLMIADGES